MASESKVTLKSSDNELFEVNETVASESLYIKNMIEDNGTVNPIPLPNVSGKILSKVIEYCKYHVEAQNLTDDEIKDWDNEFVKGNQLATLCDLILVGDYLNIKNLLALTIESVGNIMRGKTTQEIRKIFNINNDYTPQEEEDVRGENHWPFE